jgi:hypothetical protein
MSRYAILILALSVSPAVVALSQEAEEPTGARNIFYNPWTGTVVGRAAPPPERPAGGGAAGGDKSAVRPLNVTAMSGPVGIHYWLDLEGTGHVADSRTFKTGERLRFHVRSNADGYLAVWARSSTGGTVLLLPADGDPSGTRVKAGEQYVSPPVRFSAPVHDEELLLAFARRKVDLPSRDNVETNIGATAVAFAGARDLVVETEDVKPREIGTYVVNRRGGAVVRQIRLRHVSP